MTIYRTPKGFQAITITNSSASTLTVPSGANMAVISIENNSVRYRDDGTAPTTSVGIMVNPANVIEIHDGAVLSATQFIAVDNSSSALLSVSYYQQQ